MAFPPRFGVSPIPQTTFVPVYGPPMIPALSGGMITSVNPRAVGAGMRQRGPGMDQRQRQAAGMQMEKPPPTTVFVGNIHENASNDMIKSMLGKCGTILQWKRVQGPTGKFQAFGFCEYDHPDSTLRAVRLLHEWKLADKPLTVKVDEKTKTILRDFVNKRRQALGKPPIICEGDQLPCDDDMQREDALVRKALRNTMMDLGPDLVEGNEGNARPRTPELYGKGGNLDIGSLDRERKEYIAREISSFRQAYMEDNKDTKTKRHQKREEAPGPKQDAIRHKSPPSPPRELQQPVVTASAMPKSRPDSRSSIATGGRVRSPSPQESLTGTQQAPSSWNRNRRRESSVEPPAASRGRKSRSRSRLDSDDEEMALERRRLERKIREKEESYLERLKTWENRERKCAREYDRQRLKQKVQRREELREAKKLREFLEDYDDERDDPKYYKGKSYDMRRREFEKERDSDAKDRQREKEEFEEIRAKLLDEGVPNPEDEIAKIKREQEDRLSKRITAGDSSESPSPVVHTQRPAASRSDEEGAASSDSGPDEEGEKRSKIRDERPEKRRRKDKHGSETEDTQSRFVPAASDAPLTKPLGFAGLKLSSLAPASGVSGVPQSNEEEDEKKPSTSRRLVPLEYTDEEKMAVDSPLAKQQCTPGGSNEQKLTTDDKKKMVKALIEKIPTAKEELFAYPITWNQVDQPLIERRLKPWVTKKIVEYIGEDEQSLVEFICQKVSQKTPPQTIIDDISMVLDEEAGVFVVKLWRLLIYEIEAKNAGLVKTDNAG